MSGTRLIYSTWPDVESAQAAAGEAVEAGLAACANILPGMVSVFRWEGAIQTEGEVAMILKTTAAAAPALVAKMAERHPYDEPALIALDVDGACSAKPFLDWIAGAATGPAGGGAL